ncbi:MAG TPA: ATP synthase F0 subunit B [Terracidiphilus sp.]|nr:ATP synthase F0 subunit B [Terracidiphilus sp.]
MKDFARLPRRRSSILPLFLLAALVLAVCATPHGLLAQESVPAASSAPAQTESTAAGGEQTESAANDEQKELNIFRHAPIVASIGRKLGLSVETTAKIFEALNFLIILLAIVIPLAKFLPRLLRNRRETLSQNLRTARETTEDARARLNAVEAKLAGLDQEIARFRAQVEQDSLEDEKRIKASLAEESARIVTAAEQEIAAAAAQARRGLRTFAADLAIAHAEKQLVLTPETDRALIGEFIREVSASGPGKGGKN